MGPTFCNRCGDAVVEGCAWDELAELDALSERLRIKRDDRFHSPIAPTFCDRCRDAVEEGCAWDELAELNALSERLRLKRYDLKRKINRFHSSIVRQLPPDVMSTIFEFCLPDFTDIQLSPNTKEDPSIPLSLGAICSSWRDIAWSTPSLWSSLVVHVPIPVEHDLLVTTGIVQEWLARSGQLPLSIRIYSGLFGNQAFSALADIISQYSTRWSALDLCIPECFYQRFHATGNHAPILKSIRFYSSESSYYANANLEFQLTCPSLERASLSFLPMLKTHIQWDNLAHLTLHSMSIADSFLILRKAPRLVFCEVSGFFSQARYTGAPVLTSLRSLQVVQLTSLEDFLNNLTAPHLKEFSLLESYNPSMELITSFLRRSACSLRSFSVTFDIFSPYFQGFMSLLQSMPSLNTLSIISTTTNSDLENTTPEDYGLGNVLQLLTEVLSSQSTSLQQGFLPDLKILEYTGKLSLVRPGSYDDLYSLPPTDNAVHGPLHLLKLNIHSTTPSRIPKIMISYFSGLVERGVEVIILSKSEDILQSSIDYFRRKEDVLCRDWADNLDSSLFC